eukprot:673780-Pyramimonas_sp.AAC.1
MQMCTAQARAATAQTACNAHVGQAQSATYCLRFNAPWPRPRAPRAFARDAFPSSLPGTVA